ncbi:MAG TPA: farnesyl diphosphate synthase [Phycisphaerales bacterium]|nr:farnesyl diphosphate synthase [Phycisphaerales bacterium]
MAHAASITKSVIGIDAADAAEAGPLDQLRDRISVVESAMEEFITSLRLPANLDGAMRHALLAGGKRLRPALVIACCEAVGGDVRSAIAPAAAVEMIHAFSLVHDDLPALDNDDLRRGLPTVHKAFGEAMAILAGDGLMSLAFQIIAERVPDAALAGALMRELAVGTTNMIVGQSLDTLGGFPKDVVERNDHAAMLRLVHVNKTGALIRASCRMGAMAGLAGRPKTGAGEASPELRGITRYAEAIGLIFQIVDDLIDVEQSEAHTGKRVSKDAAAGKLTYPGVLGAEQSRQEISRLRAEARDALRPLGQDSQTLDAIADFLAVRTK